MTEQMQDLARRAVACKHWRWMPGMRLISGMDIPPGRIQDDGSVAHGTKGGLVVCFDDIPDLTDPATIGCLLALVREAWGDPLMWLESDGTRRWAVYRTIPRVDRLGYGSTEGEALVRTLEMAP